jgi:hypothetical protein
LLSAAFDDCVHGSPRMEWSGTRPLAGHPSRCAWKGPDRLGGNDDGTRERAGTSTSRHGPVGAGAERARRCRRQTS